MARAEYRELSAEVEKETQSRRNKLNDRGGSETEESIESRNESLNRQEKVPAAEKATSIEEKED